jgi:unsaturated chondroitin disaccharide hydrolase
MSFPPAWQAALDALCARVEVIHAACGEAWPYHCDPQTGHWDTTHDGDWCGGHWVECLRIVGELTGNKTLTAQSAARTERLRPYLERDDMFRGHRFYYSAARQYAATGQPHFRTLALAAAWSMRAMAMPVGGVMPIGTQVQVRSTTLSGRDKACVDNVHPNLILDWWAYAQTGDLAFVTGARQHLEATIRDFVRPDGSTLEFIDYDLASGQPLRHYTLLGAHDDSCWSRGQAWAIAGFLRAWEALGEARYRDTALRLLGYWQRNSAAHGVPPWDFMDPSLATATDQVPLDTSALAIVVEQLARIAVMPTHHAGADSVLAYLQPMLDGLLQFLTPAGVLTQGCFNQPKRYANRSELIWGTAYLLIALYTLKKGRALA